MLGNNKQIRIMLTLAIMLFTATPMAAQRGGNPCPIGGVPTVACPIINDSVIQATIISRLGGLIPNPGNYICVSSCRGMVTITGNVFNDKQKSVATVLASSVRGVVGVNNQLSVSPLADKDMRLAAEVREKISKSMYNPGAITIDVRDGVVRLSGCVRSELAYDMIPIIAGAVTGVVDVYNDMVISSPESQVF